MRQHYHLTDLGMFEVTAIRFDDGDRYAINGTRDFYLPPGVHRVALGLTTKVESPLKQLFSIADRRLEGPADLKTGNLQAGKTYEIVDPGEWAMKLKGNGDFAITREMPSR